MSKIGWTPPPQTSKLPQNISTDRTKGSSPQPSPEQGTGQTLNTVDTIFTKVPDITDGPQIVYNADRLWARVTLTLETAGPVAVGTSADLNPVLSGKGELLDTGIAKTFTIAKGNRLYILATGVNRVKREVEPLPWLEQITGLLSSLLRSR